MKYTPRRANKKRWLENAPDYILDIFDHPKYCDRYTVFFTGKLLISDGTYRGTYIQYLGLSGSPSHPQGFSQWGELQAYEVAQYRYRNSHRRIRWSDLPENIQRHIIARAEEG